MVRSVVRRVEGSRREEICCAQGSRGSEALVYWRSVRSPGIREGGRRGRLHRNGGGDS